MLNLIFQITALEKFFILVELKVGDAIWHNTTYSETEGTYFSVLLWYYQYTRADPHVKIGCFFIVLAVILVVWWFFSYSFEPENYESFGMAFPNEALEWWYDNLIETFALFCYFLYVSFFDLYYHWKPHLPNNFIFGTRRTNMSRYFIGERSWNPLKWAMTWSYNYKAAGFPLESGRINHWILNEITATLATRMTWKALNRRQLKSFFSLRRYLKKNKYGRRYLVFKYKRQFPKHQILQFLSLRRKFRRTHPRTKSYLTVWRRNSRLSRALYPWLPSTMLRHQRYIKRGSIKELWYVTRMLKKYFPEEWRWRHRPVRIYRPWWKRKFRKVRKSKKFSLRIWRTERKFWRSYKRLIREGRGGSVSRLSKYHMWLRRLVYVKRRRYVQVFSKYFNRYVGRTKTLSVNINKTHRRRINRGRSYTRHHIFVQGFDRRHNRSKCMHNVRHRYHIYDPIRLGRDDAYQGIKSNLTDLQVSLHHWIQTGRRNTYISLIQRAMANKWNTYTWNDLMELKLWAGPTRPKWHPWYFRYYYLTGDEDLISRGAQFASNACMHWSIGPVYLFVALYNGYCWEEEEIEMYEDEFEDWDMEYKQEDMALLRVTDATREREYDRDLAAFVVEESEELKGLHHSEERQAWRDLAAEEDHAAILLDENVDEDIDIIDADIAVSYDMDYYSLIFEYYTDPHILSNNFWQLDFEWGIDMPPAWGFLQAASVHTQDALDKVDGMIHSYYHHNAVFDHDGVSTTALWWDKEPKCWIFDGTPLDEVVYVNRRIKEMFLFYFTTYVVKKRTNEPEIYQKMIAIDKEQRRCRPHYHGLAVWRGYDVLKEDYALYVERLLAALPDDERQDLQDFTMMLSERERRGELIPEDEISIVREYQTWRASLYEDIPEDEEPEPTPQEKKGN